MTGIAFGLLALLAATGVLLFTQIRRGDRRTDELRADDKELVALREQLGAKTVELERKTFELGNANTALDIERTRAAALEEYVDSQAQDLDPNADLAPDDLAGRLSRLSRKLGATAAEAHPGRSPVRREAVAAVPSKPSAEDVHKPGPDDLLRPD